MVNFKWCVSLCRISHLWLVHLLISTLTLLRRIPGLKTTRAHISIHFSPSISIFSSRCSIMPDWPYCSLSGPCTSKAHTKDYTHTLCMCTMERTGTHTSLQVAQTDTLKITAFLPRHLRHKQLYQQQVHYTVHTHTDNTRHRHRQVSTDIRLLCWSGTFAHPLQKQRVWPELFWVCEATKSQPFSLSATLWCWIGGFPPVWLELRHLHCQAYRSTASHAHMDKTVQ